MLEASVMTAPRYVMHGSAPPGELAGVPAGFSFTG